jgi:hypothetical protein
MQTDEILEALQRDGIAVLANVISPDQLGSMCRTFNRALSRLRLNDLDGFNKTERLRDMVEDVLLLDQAFVDVAVDPLVIEVARRYVGAKVQLVECKGWRSRTTRKDWHGWHGDGWYDQDAVGDLPRELNLAFYLSDVRSGGFEYLRGSHRKTKPRSVPLHEIGTVWKQEKLLINGIAGTAFLFDTSGIHRKSTPILEPRIAAFYCYHDPALPLQQEDIEYGRYHPLLLNAAFLGGLSSEQQRMLGFGDKRKLPSRSRCTTHPVLDGLYRACIETSMFAREVSEPFERRIRGLFVRANSEQPD